MNDKQGVAEKTTTPFTCQFVAHIHKKSNLFILRRTIQHYGQPRSFIYMPAEEDAWFLPDGADQSGIAFQIHRTDFIIARQPQVLSEDIHAYGNSIKLY